ncbi:MAG: RDD family protein [Asgard group archaeon]|nr:RDD family protein [Asgard group archaeon]
MFFYFTLGYFVFFNQKYISLVKKHIPGYNEIKKDVLEQFILDIQDTIDSTDKEIDPISEFGEPKEVAAKLCQSQNWIDNIASLKIRSLAFVFDIIIIGMIFSGMIILSNMLINYEVLLDPLTDNMKIFVTVMGYLCYVLAPIFYVLYWFILEMISDTSPGKRILNLYVIDVNGSKTQKKQIFIRNLTKIIFPVLVFDIIPFFLERNHKYIRVYDQAAKTIVVKLK